MPRLPTCCAAFLAATLLAGTAQASQTFDFAAMTCGDFLRATPAGREAITLWLDGRLSTRPQPTRVDMHEVLLKVQPLLAACEELRDAKIARVFELQEQQEQQWPTARISAQ
jgi:hypothetical protein